MVPHSDEVAWTRTPFESDCPQNHPVVNLLFGIAVAIGLLTTIEIMPGVFLSEAILLLCGVLVVAGSRSRGVTRCAAFHWTMVPMIAAVAWVLIAMLMMPEALEVQTLREVTSKWLLRGALVASCLVVLASSTGAVYAVVRASTVSILAYSAAMVAVVIQFGDWGILRQASRNDIDQVIGVAQVLELGNASWVSRNVVMALPFAMWGLRRAPTQLVGVTLLAAVVIAACRSRLGIAAFMLECMAALTLLQLSARARVVLLLVALASLVIAGQQVAIRMAERDSATVVDAVSVREALLQTGLSLIAERPMLGWGLGTSDELVNSSRAVLDSLAMHSLSGPVTVHNNFLLYAVSSGLPAALLMLGGLVALVGETYRTASRRREPCRSLGYMAATALGVVVMAMQTDVVYRPVMVWVIVSCAVALACGSVGSPDVPNLLRWSRQRGRVEVAPTTVPNRRDDER